MSTTNIRRLENQDNDDVKETLRVLLQKRPTPTPTPASAARRPSDCPDFAVFLVRHGIDSISLNPDGVIDVLERVAEVEKEDTAVAV